MSDKKCCWACSAILIIVLALGAWYGLFRAIQWFGDMNMDAAKWRGHEQAIKEKETHDEIEAEKIRQERLKREQWEFKTP